MKHIILVGACYMDTILTVDHYPSEDEKLRASNLTRRCGGNCPNSLQVLAQLIDEQATTDLPAGQLHLISTLPDESSQAAELIRTSVLSDYINRYRNPLVTLDGCEFVKGVEEAASSYVIKSKSTDTRTIVNYNGLPEMTFELFQKKFHSLLDSLHIEQAYVHFEGRIPDVTVECIRWLRTSYPTLRISVEVEKPGRPGLKELAAEAEAIFYSKSWAVDRGYQTAMDCVEGELGSTRNGALLCCTWGADGAAALQKIPKGGEYFLKSPETVNAWSLEGGQVVDTIGAGDTFIAGMLYGLVFRDQLWILKEQLEFANELAGRKVSQEGFSGLAKIILDNPKYRLPR